MSAIRWWALGFGALYMGVFAGCTCGGDPPVTGADGGAGVCSSGAATCTTAGAWCDDRHICKKDKKTSQLCCERTYLRCTTAAECCPGQVCTSEGRCVDKFDECTKNEDCGENGDRVCEEWVDPMLGATMRCTYKHCGADGACPDGQSCFAGFCVLTPPCNGECPEGTACVPQNNRCHPVGARCSLEPKPGHMIVLSKPDNVYDSCNLPDIGCAYVELPPLASFDLGRHVSVAAQSGKLHVAHYDGQYGDLVVSEFDTSGKRLKSTWVDGVPSGRPVVGGPTGPRGGVVDPGDDVGRYASIAVRADGSAIVAYYDQTHGDLRIVDRSATGTWGQPYVLDGDAADVGMYASLVIDPEGMPAVAYFQRSASEGGSVSCPSDPTAPKALLTGVKFARARAQKPASETDWDVETVACRARPTPACWGCATPGAKVCAVDPAAAVKGATICAPPSTACSPACASGEVCISNGSASLCAKQGNPTELGGMPPGIGLFPSLVFKNGAPVVAWYDQVKGNLMASQKTGATWSSIILDGEEAGADTGDVGLYPSLALDANGNYAIAYQDQTRRALRYFSSATLSALKNQLKPAGSTFIDKGLADARQDGPSFVGADATLLFTSLGPAVAYQNSTAADLRLALREGSTWRVAKEWTEGASGFFANAVEMDKQLYVIHTRMRARLFGGKPVADTQIGVEKYTP